MKRFAMISAFCSVVLACGGNSPTETLVIETAAVTITPTDPTILVGATVQLKAIATDAAGNVLEGRVINWLSSDVGIATVTSTGLVTGVAAGFTVIVATNQSKSATADVTVLSVAPDILVVESASSRIRRIAGDGTSSTVFFDGIDSPRGIAVEANGDVVVVELTGNLRRITADGSSSTIFFSGLNQPSGVAVAPNGDLVVSEDTNGGSLWRITSDGNNATVVANNIRSEDVDVDQDGSILVFQELTGQLLRVAPSGVVTVLVDGLAAPTALALESTGDIIAVEFGGTVRRISPDGSANSVILSGLSNLEGVAVASDGYILVTESSQSRIIRIAPDGTSSEIFFTGILAPDHLIELPPE